MGGRNPEESTEVSSAIDGKVPLPTRRGFATAQGWPLVWLALLLILLGAIVYGPTLRLSYAYDDIDHLNLAADYLSGRLPLREMLLRPHHEHVIPAFRLLVAAAARVAGTDATFVRVGILLSHVAGAFVLSLLAFRLTRRRAAAVATGVSYVLAAGFSSMFIWFPSGGIFPLGTLGIAGAALLVTEQGEIGRRRALVGAGAGILFALLLENGLFPLAAGPALLDEIERRRDKAPSWPIGALTVFALLASCAAVVATFVLQGRTISTASTLSPAAVLSRFAFLALSAPFRLFFPAQHVPTLLGSPGGSPRLLMAYGGVIVAFVGALLIGVHKDRSRPLLLAALALAPGPIAFLAFVALARSRTPPGELFDSDRYYFPLLVPIALFVGLAAVSIADSVRTWSRARKLLFCSCLTVAVFGELALNVVAVRRRVPVAIYDAHAKRFSQMKRLAEILNRATTSPRLGGAPLEVPDEEFFFKDVHNNRLSARFLLSVAGHERTGRVRLVSAGVGPASEAVLNSAFAQWASEAGDESIDYRVIGGHLQLLGGAGMARFAAGPADQAVGEGFYEWESPYRWMARRGTLRLVVAGPRFRLKAFAPLTALSRNDPGVRSVDIEVSIQGAGNVQPLPLGRVRLSSDDIVDGGLPLPAALFEAFRDKPVTVILQSSCEWRPRDVLPGSVDDRLLSVRVYEAGFTN
jgi:hypothetical protein